MSALGGSGYGGGGGTGTLLALGGAAALIALLSNSNSNSNTPATPAAPTAPAQGVASATGCPPGYNFTAFGMPNNPNPNGSGLCCPPANTPGPCYQVTPLTASNQSLANIGSLTQSGGGGCPGNYTYNAQYNSCAGRGGMTDDSDGEGGINDTNT